MNQEKPNSTEKEVGKKTQTTDSQPDSLCNENYHFLFEQATDAIMVTDFQGNFKNVNTSLCNMFGYTKEELLGLNIRSLLDPEHLKEKPIRFDLLAEGQTIINERKMVHRDGTIIYVESNAKKFKDDR